MSTEIKIRHPRPSKLSDPCHDFTPDMLSDLISKNDKDMAWTDYANLFGPHLPAGTYEEVIYFLPQAFFFLMEHDEDALDLVTPIFGFCSKNRSRLHAEGILEPVEKKIIECLSLWTSKFEITHYDITQCSKKGWKLTHQDIVKNSEVVCEALAALVEFESMKSIAVGFIESIADFSGNCMKAKWFLELSRARFEVYKPPQAPEINDVLCNTELIQNAYAFVFETVLIEEASPTYWDDTFNLLNI